MSQSNLKAWIKHLHRNNNEYFQGIEFFMDFAMKHSPPGLTTCSCPCRRCENKKRASFETVKDHLIWFGMLSTYNFWIYHGEKPDMDLTDASKHQFVQEDEILEEDTDENGGVLGNFVDDAFGVRNEAPSDGEANNVQTYSTMPNNYFASYLDHGDRYNEYKRIAREKLYPGCEDGHTTLSVIVELHNLKKEFNWSGNSVTELLKRLTQWLPKGNTLPDKYPVMKQMLRDLGMQAKCIHACENNCMLFWKEYENVTECSQYGTPRYKVKEQTRPEKVRRESKEPRKVLRHFPLVPRLRRLYTIPWIAQKMQWHKKADPSWDLMRHPIDSAEWRTLKCRWPEFANEGRNVWLGIATDGFNPRGVLSSNYSCWPVYVIPYNLPPSLCMKSEFQMMCLLIPGPKAPSQDIDVFLQPLVDELKQLWAGVSAFDMDRRENFTLRAMLLWGIHDFPALGSLSGCVTHGYKACPICATEIESEWISGKNVYTSYRKFLKEGHPFRSVKRGWYKTEEHREPPRRLFGPALLQKLDRINYTPGKLVKDSGKRRAVDVDDIEEVDVHDSNGERSAWYKKSILFDLEYWQSHKVRHAIDMMHTEKNVAEHLVNIILDKKGQRDSDYALDNAQKRQCCQVLIDAKLPSGFSSNLGTLVSLQPLNLHIKKSHDYHIIIQYLLPVMLQHVFLKNRDLKRAIMQVCLYFNILCSKILVREHVQAAKDMIAEALCVLQHYFPAKFFDISIHLMVHLADQALLCGPTRYIWMYPFERAMKECKDIPSNKRYVEGSITEAYLVSESVRYAMEYMPNSRDGNHSSTQASFLVENGDDVYERSIIEGKMIKLTGVQWRQIRRWILFRLEIPKLAEYYSLYRSLLETTTRGNGRVTNQSEVVIQSEFIDWLHKKLIEEKCMTGELWRYVSGPIRQAKIYIKYRCNGYIFSPQSYDDKVVTQNSGVTMDAITTFRASAKDTNLKDDDTTWYGIIKEIIEVDYYDFRHVVFYYDWVNVGDKTNGCKLCPDSNLLIVNLKKMKSTDGEYDEPAILSFEASQVFYVRDNKNPDWSVVLRSPKRMTDEVDDLEITKNFQSYILEQPHLAPLLKCIEKK